MFFFCCCVEGSFNLSVGDTLMRAEWRPNAETQTVDVIVVTNKIGGYVGFGLSETKGMVS